jgi:hypothetical protein
METGKCRATVFFLSLLGAACRIPPPSLPAVTVPRNPDGTETRHVNAGQFASQAEVEQRLLTSIECPNYEIVGAGQSAEQRAEAFIGYAVAAWARSKKRPKAWEAQPFCCTWAWIFLAVLGTAETRHPLWACGAFLGGGTVVALLLP